MTETGFYILYCLQNEMHGYNIIQKVRQMTNGEISHKCRNNVWKLVKDGKGWFDSVYKRGRKTKILHHYRVGEGNS